MNSSQSMKLSLTIFIFNCVQFSAWDPKYIENIQSMELISNALRFKYEQSLAI
jgi:hypothetical protein